MQNDNFYSPQLFLSSLKGFLLVPFKGHLYLSG